MLIFVLLPRFYGFSLIERQLDSSPWFFAFFSDNYFLQPIWPKYHLKKCDTLGKIR